MNLKDQITNDNKKIAVAKEIFNKALQKFTEVKLPIETEHRDILNKFRKIINDKIEAENDIEEINNAVNGERIYRDPDLYTDAWFDENGIHMIIEANHPNDIIDAYWSWDDVERILKLNEIILHFSKTQIL
jgi:hypothetical protein